jgi:hypothetical protein
MQERIKTDATINRSTGNDSNEKARDPLLGYFRNHRRTFNLCLLLRV